MSGPKISEYELEQLRRQRLREALEARKAKYCCAISMRQGLLKQIQASATIFESKLEVLKSMKHDNQQIVSAYLRQANAIKAVCRKFDDIMNEPIPRMDEITESESTQCKQADFMNERTETLKSQFDHLLAKYDKEEKQIGENIEYIKANIELERQREESRQAIRQCSDKLQKIASSAESVSEMENAVSAIKSVRTDLLDNADRLLHLLIPPQTKDVKNLIIKTRQESEALINLADKNIQGPLEHIKNYAAARKEVSDILDDFDARRKRAALSDTLTKMEDIRFAEYEEPNYYKTLEEDARKKLDSLLDKIEDTICDVSVCAEDTQCLGEIYINIQKTAEHSRRSLAAEIIQAQDILAQVKLRSERFEQCYCRYATACEMLNQLYKAGGEENRSVKVMDRMDFISLNALCDEEMRINGILALENERCFIRKTIDEVMREFGYNMAEEFVLHREQRGTHLLCRKEGDDTAIHVQYGTGVKRRIMLEVVGVGKTFRGNLDNGVNGQIIGPDALPEGRRKQLLDRQTAFCLIHPKIIEALGKKGIRTSSIELNPPGIEFCEEIAVVDKIAGEKGLADEGKIAGEKRLAVGGEDAKRRPPRKKSVPGFMEKRMSKRKFF